MSHAISSFIHAPKILPDIDCRMLVASFVPAPPPPPVTGVPLDFYKPLNMTGYRSGSASWIRGDGTQGNRFGVTIGFWYWKQSTKKWMKGGKELGE